jgi:addiction module HigA family antidote
MAKQCRPVLKERPMPKPAVHPGEVLKEELDARGVSPTELARRIDVPANRVSQIVAGKRMVTADTALRLAHWFGTDPRFWMNLQAQFDLVAAEREAGERIRALPTGDAGPEGVVPE